MFFSSHGGYGFTGPPKGSCDFPEKCIFIDFAVCYLIRAQILQSYKLSYGFLSSVKDNPNIILP